MNITKAILLPVLCGLLFIQPAAAVQMKDVPHPFLLWTREDITSMRGRMKSDPAFQKQIETYMVLEARSPKAGGNPDLLALFKYVVLEDKAAGEGQKRALLKFINFKMPEAGGGDPEARNSRWREDHTLTALRYDLLYDELTEAERKGIEDSAQALAVWCQKNPGPWTIGDPGLKQGSRTGWLPNMQWPTMIGAHVLAVATKNQAQIEALAKVTGGWQWYFDDYVADGRFYMEEFAKYYSNIGSMILWCNGLERLGLNQFGWGFTGKGGATMRRFLSCLPDAGLPQVARPDAPGYFDVPTVWMGDAGREWIARGAMPDWSQNRMNGAIAKMRQPLWWEASTRRFPEDNLGFFLTKTLLPEEPKYLPSPYFMLKPIAPADVKPPAAKSSVNFERGFALLRAEEGPGYWESPKPAVALQFGMYYVHYVHDCFSILDFVAHNRFIYDKIGRSGTSYAGGDSWRDHGRGQASGIVVDDLRAEPVDKGEEGCKNHRIRQALEGPARFVAARAAGIFPDVDLERAMILCPEYLLDATWLSSPRSRVFDWHVLSAGFLPDDELKEWVPLEEFSKQPNVRPLDKPAQFMTGTRGRDVRGEPWTTTILLPPGTAAPNGAEVIGVKLHMLGQPGTLLVMGNPPQPPPPPLKEGAVTPAPSGPLGTKVLATREGPATCFTAVHEPLKGGSGGARIASVKSLSKSIDVVALSIEGKPGSGINDRLLMRLADAAGKAESISADGETIGALNSAWVRIHKDHVEAWGDLTELQLRTKIRQLKMNGKDVSVPAEGDLFVWKK
jgi:hypothetical protein